MAVTRTAAGRFEARFYDAKGRDRQVTKAERHLAEMELVYGAGPRSQDDLAGLSPEAYLHLHRHDFEAGGGAAVSADMFVREAERWILPHINGQAIASIGVTDIRDMLAEWREAESAEASCRQRSFITDWIFDAAWRRGAVTRNVSRDFFSRRGNRPRARRPDPHRPPQEDDVALMRGAVIGKPFQSALLELVLATRPNAQELQALSRSDIAGGSVRYRFTVEKEFVVEQANVHCNRTVPLGEAGPAIEEWLAVRGSLGWAESPYVFPYPDGRRRPDVFRYYLKKIQYDAGIARYEAPPCRSIDDFKPRYTVEGLGNRAVSGWLADGKRGLELSSLIGCSEDGMARFTLMVEAAEAGARR